MAGLLFGDYASLPITKLFVDLRLSPDIATVGMLLTGLVGSVMQLGSPLWALIGAGMLLLYYVLDCVDGEVARFQNVENIKWGYYEYIFHLLVKPIAFLGVGIGLFIELGNVTYVVAAAFAAVATLWLKIFVEIPGIMFLHGVIGSAPGKDQAFRHYATELELHLDAQSPAPGSSKGGFPLGLNRVTLRALATNFDVGLLLLVIATAVDLQLPGPELPVLGAATWRGVWMAYYGVVLPLDFIDYLRSYLIKGHFPSEMTRMLLLAHHFKVPAGGTPKSGSD